MGFPVLRSQTRVLLMVQPVWFIPVGNTCLPSGLTLAREYLPSSASRKLAGFCRGSPQTRIMPPSWAEANDWPSGENST